MFKHVKFSSLPVSDQDRALAFYRDRIGLTLATGPAVRQRLALDRVRGGRLTAPDPVRTPAQRGARRAAEPQPRGP